MTYALVVANAIQSVGPLPRSARRLDVLDKDGKPAGDWVMGLATADLSLQQACGYFPVTDVARPADTATNTFDRSVQLVNGTPTVVWTQRPMTAPELANVAAITNRTTIQTQAATALTNNRTYLAIGSPSNAQVVAQVRALTNQSQGVIRLLLNQLDAVG